MDKIFLGASMQEVLFTDIHKNFFSFLSELLIKHHKLFCIVDEIVFKTMPIVRNKSIHFLPFAASEKAKSRKMKEEIEDQILQKGITKKDAILAIGGGITLDLAGFIAATVLRGIDFYSVPTTLMAMVDAAIGGKNGVNTQFGKNLIGSFYLPKKIWIDLHFLSTLSPIDVLNGLSEIIKYAIVADQSIFSLLIENDLFSASLIHRCIQIKKTITEKDFSERNLRLLLNFGHTVGHAIEFASNYAIPHGIAVFFGMIIETFFSKEFSPHLPTLFSFQDKFHYPKISHSQIDWDLFQTSLHFDKKRTSDKIPIVVHSPIINKSTARILGEFTADEVTQKAEQFFLNLIN